MMEILLILLALYVFRDYIAFLVLALPLRAFNSRMRIAPATEQPAGQSEMGGVKTTGCKPNTLNS